jgi:hypothetical protein
MDRGRGCAQSRHGRGAMVFQFNPHDLLDWDGIAENILLGACNTGSLI